MLIPETHFLFSRCSRLSLYWHIRRATGRLFRELSYKRRNAKMKYPIGIQSFDRIIEDGYVYVDKTDMIYDLTHEGGIYFLSRPRRFGKSLLVSTLKNYYLGRKDLFKGLAIDGMEKEWNVYPVFHVDFNGSDFTQAGVLEKRINGYVSDWEKEYGVVSDGDTLDLGGRFIKILEAAHAKTGRRAVVLIDEYDKPILDVLDMSSSLKTATATFSRPSTLCSREPTPICSLSC